MSKVKRKRAIKIATGIYERYSKLNTIFMMMFTGALVGKMLRKKLREEDQ